MQFQKDWKLSSPSAPIFKGLYGTFWAIPSGPSMSRSLKAYSGQQQHLAVSKLSFPDSVIHLILDYCCAVNDFVLVLSTPLHYIFEVWALWADILDAFDFMRVQDYKMRCLGSWDYKDLTSLLCISGRYDLSTTSDWLELVQSCTRR